MKLIVFGFDAAEAAQIRRIRSYLACGFEVLGFTMRRGNMNADFTPFWENIHLGEVENEAIGKRLGTLARALPILRRARARLEGADVIVARNLDMLALAAFARSLIRGKKPALVYECLDIHSMMTAPGWKGRLFRWLERRLLARTRLLILSSPTFLSAYFAPTQGWRGETALLENKLSFPEGTLARPKPESAHVAAPGGVIRLGWVGTLRCPKSLALLVAAAEALGPRLQLQFHGVVHDHALPDFAAQVAAHDNIQAFGPYAYPEGLAAAYGQCDLVWSQDLWQWGTNSTWLLPNRIYEASYFGCPSLAVAGTATGERVAQGLGWTLPEPSAGALIECLEGLTPEALAEARRALLSRPEGDFRLTDAEVGAVLSRARA